MWGMIAKITCFPGKRSQLLEILKQAAADMPGCLSYIIAESPDEDNVLWVSEAWDSQTSHDASLSLPGVREALPRARPLIVEFERIAVTDPVWGIGLSAKTAS